MKKKIYRVYLNTTDNSIQKMALLACLSNGGDNKITLTELEAIFKGDKMQLPISFSDYTLTSFPNSISVDRNTGAGVVNILFIEEVEIIELNPEADEN